MAGEIQRGVQIVTYSSTGEIASIISDSNETGNILELKYTELKNGGLDVFEFSLARNTDVPITVGTICYFYINGTLWDTGYVIELPQVDQDEPVFMVRGHGWLHRLKEKFIDTSYTTTAFGTIVNNFLSTYLTSDLGIIYDAGEITLPTGVAAFTIYFTNRSMFDCIQDFINIANYDYTNEQYRFWIGPDRKLHIDLIDETIADPYVLVEGYNYQSPEVELDDSKLVNKVLGYRTTTANPDDLELFATYQDTASQGKYGIKERKFTWPGALSGNVAFQNMANAFLEKYKEPREKVTINDFELPNIPVQYRTYRLYNKRTLNWILMGEYNSLSNWDLTNLINGSASIQTSTTLTQRQIIRLQGSNASGEYIEYILPQIVFFPTVLRIFSNFTTTPQDFSIAFIDQNDVIFEVPLVQVQGWAKTELRLGTEILEGDLYVNDTVSTDDVLGVNITGVIVDTLLANQLIVEGVDSIKAIRIVWNSDTAATLFVDRIEVQFDTYLTRDLIPERTKYKLSAQAQTAVVDFGEISDSLVDSVKEETKQGDLAFQVFARN